MCYCFQHYNILILFQSSPASLRLDETVLQSLTSITRRTNTINSVSHQQPDPLQIIMEFLRTGTSYYQCSAKKNIFGYI